MILKKFPMPPTSNQLYAPVRGRFIKSVAAKKFDSAVSTYSLINFRNIEKIKTELETIFQNTAKTLHVDCQFVFLRNRVIGLKGQFKRLDASNRIKQTHDAISKILEIDDSLFISCSFSKVMCQNEADEQVIITISKTSILSI